MDIQILSEEFPGAEEHLIKSRTLGTPWHMMCKLSILNPDAIEETNFPTGRHKAKPTGRVKFPQRDELLLFHYKYLGFERTFLKQNLQFTNLGEHDIAMGGMAHYGWSRKELRDHWDGFLKDSKNLLETTNRKERYPFYHRWWRPGIHYFISLWIGRGKKFFRNPGHMVRRLASYFEYYKNHLIDLPRRLGMFINKQKHFTPHEKFGDYMEEINRSPLRKQIYQTMMEGGATRDEKNIIMTSNGSNARGTLIHCLRSKDTDMPLNDIGIQKAVTEKEKLEEQHQNKFDTFVITNSIKFDKNAKNLARKNNIKLVTQFDLIKFISQIKAF